MKLKLKAAVATLAVLGATVAPSSAQAASPMHCYTWIGVTESGIQKWVAECEADGITVSSAAQGVYFDSHAQAVWAIGEFRGQTGR